MEKAKEALREYLVEMIEACPKTQKQIAREAGFANSNVISMIKTGEMALPLERAPALARSLGIDEAVLVIKVIQETNADTYKTLAPYLAINKHEQAMLKVMRSHAKIVSSVAATPA